MGRAGDEHDDGSPDDFDDSHHDDDADEDDEEPQAGGPPHPLDRLWFHPSELASLAPGRARSASRARRPAPGWMVPVASGAIGALVAIVVLASTGTLDRPPADGTAASGIPNRSGPGAVAASARVRGIGPSVVAVAARDANGARRGSGVCVQNKHEVLTSTQVVGDATTVEVTTSDGKQHTARVVGRDAVTGLALLAVDATLVVAPVARSTPEVGDPVWILGAPAAGEEPWFSDGVIASTDALIALDAGPTTSGLLETNAVGNAWAAGGALVDTEAVLAIVLAPVAGSPTSFAMPVDAALRVADSLRAHDEVPHGSLGVEGVDDPVNGPTVVGFPEGGPASKSGLRAGDIVLSVAGRQVDSMVQIMAIVRNVSPGAKVPVVVRRGHRQLKMSVLVGSTVAPSTTTTSAAPAVTTVAPAG